MPMSPMLPSETATARSRSDVEAAVAHWRAEHPDATLAEIEQAVDRRLSAYRAALITAAATAACPGDPPVCGACGRQLQRVGARSRQVRTAHDGELVFTESAWRCPGCGAGVSPPD